MHAAKSFQEIVEDSEPERELLRQQRRLEKKRKAEAVRLLPVVTISDDSAPSSPGAAVVPHSLSVVEITSSSSSQSDLKLSARSGVPNSISVIEISSDSSSAPSPAASAPSSPKNAVNRAILFDPVLDHPSLQDSLQDPIPKSVPDNPMDKDGDRPVKFDFNKFTFKNPHPPTKTLPRPGPSRAPPELPGCRPVKTAKTQPSVFLETISNVQLSKLGKCVSCDIKWTTRKGAGPKRTHMKSCARKHSFTDETILVLVLRELENTLSVKKGKEKAQTTVVVKAPETIFEKVINDAAPKKRVRRIGVTETVKDPLDRRESILARAQSILLPSRSWSIDSETSMEPTQVFGRSDLKQRQSFCTGMFYGASADSGQYLDEETFTSTQPFAPSNLGTTVSNSRDMMDAHVLAESDINNRAAEIPTLFNVPFYDIYRPSPSSSDPYPRLTSAKNNEMPLSPADSVNANIECDDGAYLHYDPSLDEANYHQIPTEGCKRKLNKQNKSTQKRTRNEKTNEEPMPSTAEEFGKDWEQAVRHKILQNRDLHQRILRYEPIHFDVFLKMVSPVSDASGKLKSQLRLLLDKLAINFYGADPVSRRKH